MKKIISTGAPVLLFLGSLVGSNCFGLSAFDASKTHLVVMRGDENGPITAAFNQCDGKVMDVVGTGAMTGEVIGTVKLSCLSIDSEQVKELRKLDCVVSVQSAEVQCP